jgi:hypothetical protein
MQATCVVRTTNLPARIQDGALVTLVLRLLATWTGSCAVEVIWARVNTSGESPVRVLSYTLLQSVETRCLFATCRFDDVSEPAWGGSSWGAATQFCDAQRMELCPVDVYCPNGVNQPPVGGTKNGDKWSPVSDAENRWVQVGIWSGDPSTTCQGHHEIAQGVHGDPAWGVDESRHGFMQYILCCEMGTTEALRQQGPLRFGVSEEGQLGEWINANGEYNSWGAAVDFCIAHGADDLCPLDMYCPDGAGNPPYAGRRVGRNGDDQWAPYGGGGDNRYGVHTTLYIDLY